jgi:hypothetical protein
MVYVAENPRSVPAGFESGRSLALSLMMRSEPARPISARERAARLARIKQRTR